MLRSILALLLLATVGVSAYANALSFQWMADRARDLATDVFQGEDGDADSTMPMKKKKGGPKRRASYDRYEMEGVYTIHVAREGEDLETAGTRTWYITKTWDKDLNAARLEAIPYHHAPHGHDLNGDDFDEDEDHGGHHRPLGAMTILSYEDSAVLLFEDPSSGKSGDAMGVRCMPLHRNLMRHCDPLEGAQFHALTFEEGELVHQYTKLNLCPWKGTTVKHSELSLDAFDEEPVSLMAAGHAKCPSTNVRINFALHFDVKHFESLSKRDAKLDVSMPETVKNLCERHSVLEDDEEAADILAHASMLSMI